MYLESRQFLVGFIKAWQMYMLHMKPFWIVYSKSLWSSRCPLVHRWGASLIFLVILKCSAFRHAGMRWVSYGLHLLNEKPLCPSLWCHFLAPRLIIHTCHLVHLWWLSFFLLLNARFPTGSPAQKDFYVAQCLVMQPIKKISSSWRSCVRECLDGLLIPKLYVWGGGDWNCVTATQSCNCNPASSCIVANQGSNSPPVTLDIGQGVHWFGSMKCCVSLQNI